MHTACKVDTPRSKPSNFSTAAVDDRGSKTQPRMDAISAVTNRGFVMRLLAGKKKNDQANRLRKLTAQQGSSNGDNAVSTIVVLGAKGGVGTTSLTWRLTQSLTAEHTPLAIDAHLWQPDLARVAGMISQTGPGLASVLAGDAAAADAVQIGDGPALLPGEWTATVNHDTEQFSDRLQNHLIPDLGKRFSAVVIDGGPVRSPWAMPLCSSASLVLLVVTADELSLLGGYSFAKELAANSEPPPVRVVVNHCAGETHGRATHTRLRDACREHLDMQVLLAGWLAHDPRMAIRTEPPIPLMRPLARRVSEAIVESKTNTSTAKAA